MCSSCNDPKINRCDSCAKKTTCQSCKPHSNNACCDIQQKLNNGEIIIPANALMPCPDGYTLAVVNGMWTCVPYNP